MEEKMANYSIGIDFGRERGLAVLVNTESGRIVASAEKEYSHGTFNADFERGEDCDAGYAFQHPMDYLEVISETIPSLIENSAVDPDDVCGIGVSFAPCSLLPVMKDGTPLCFFKEFENEAHAYVKLREYKIPQDKIEKINSLTDGVYSLSYNNYLTRCGGSIKEESFALKIWDTLSHAPAVFDTCDGFINAADWIVWQLSGSPGVSRYQAMRSEIFYENGSYPSDVFFAELDPRLVNLRDKIVNFAKNTSENAGRLSPFVAKSLGLSGKTTVSYALGNMQALSLSGFSPDSATLLLNSDSNNDLFFTARTMQFLPEQTSVIEDSVYPDNYIYEKEFPRTAFPLPESVRDGFIPGASGILSLDEPANLVVCSGSPNENDVLQSRFETSAFRLKHFIKSLKKHGIPIRELMICGKISDRNEYEALHKLYSDVLDLNVSVYDQDYLAAKGAAISGAVFSKPASAQADRSSMIKKMHERPIRRYMPHSASNTAYEKLYLEYTRLYDFLASDSNKLLSVLEQMKNEASDSQNTEASDVFVPTLESEFGISDNADLNNDTAVLADDETEEVRLAAENASKELFEAIDAVAQIRNEAEVYALFKDLIEEEAEKHTKEILAAADDVANLMMEADAAAAEREAENVAVTEKPVFNAEYFDSLEDLEPIVFGKKD